MNPASSGLRGLVRKSGFCSLFWKLSILRFATNNKVSITYQPNSCQHFDRCCNLIATARFQFLSGFNMSDGKQAPQNIQDAFLNTVRREKTTVIVYLLNGAKLTGRIRSFDKFSILLESGSQEQLIFKHAISTISQTRRNSGDLRSHGQAEPAFDPASNPNSPQS